MKIYALLIAVAAFFGWWDFSHHIPVVGTLTLCLFAGIAFLNFLIRRRKARIADLKENGRR